MFVPDDISEGLTGSDSGNITGDVAGTVGGNVPEYIAGDIAEDIAVAVAEEIAADFDRVVAAGVAHNVGGAVAEDVLGYGTGGIVEDIGSSLDRGEVTHERAYRMSLVHQVRLCGGSSEREASLQSAS